MSRIEETEPYSLLAQNNEGSALSIPAIETNAGIPIAVASENSEEKRARNINKLRPSEFYVVKAVVGDDVLYAFRKTDRSWKTKKSVSLYFSDHSLDIDPSPSMDLSQTIDFFVLEEDVLILNKANFESILMYKQAHADAFDELKNEEQFSSIFVSLDAFDSYVGTNKIQLRRASAIQQKGHYRDDNFMQRLRTRASEFGLSINFDASGRIIPCEMTCRDIFQALLDHRLSSAFSEGIYDVPNATRVDGV
jgi:hypothetical protein